MNYVDFSIEDDALLARMLDVPINEERPWMVFSACRDQDPDIFFPQSQEATDHAIAICNSCPVKLDCLEYSLEARERFGIWGGTTEKQRRQLLRLPA